MGIIKSGLIDKILSPLRRQAVDDALQNGEWMKRAQELGVLAPQSPTPRGMFFDPMTLVTQTQFKERNSGLTFEVLKTMAERTEVINAIINTRVAQIGSFCQPARWKNKTGLGFQVRFKEAKKKPTKEEQIRLNNLEEMIYNCGYTNRYRSGERRPNFGEFIRMFLRDSLIYDQACFEIIPNRIGEPCEWWPVDASSFRLNQAPKNLDGYKDGRDVEKYVQVYQGIPRHKFNFKELAFCVRNVRSDLRNNGYGFSELEQLINMVTAVLWAEEYNKRWFSQGQMINGILNLKGQNIPPDMLEAFRRQWQALASSVTNAHKIPVLTVKDGIEFTNLHSSNRDMEYTAWMEYLTKIITAVYLIDPAEINFDSHGASESAPLFESSPEAKLKHSRDKGLRNLLNFIEEKINFHIVHEIDSDLFFEFVGIDMKDEQELVNIRASEVQAYKTINEVREEAGLEPIKGKIDLNNLNPGDLIENSVLVNMLLQVEAQKQQAEMAQQQQGGAEGPKGDPGDSVTHAEGMDPSQQTMPAPASPQGPKVPGQKG